MKEKKDWGFILFVVGFILAILIVVGSIIYGIYRDNLTCFDIAVEYLDGSTNNYHCEYYNCYDNRYELFLHDGTKLILLKTSIKRLVINEVID